jgi:uncharacterized protein YlxW (UPF0749 family)
MSARAAQLSLFAVALLIGVLLVGQLRSQQRPTEISQLPAQELSQLIDTLADRNRELRNTLVDLNGTLDEYRIAGNQGQSALEVTREDLRRISAFGGLTPVEGQGMVLEVDGSLDAIALNDLVNELRNAGAEAIAVDDVRITHRSVAVQGPRGLVIDGVEIGPSFRIAAVGSPDGLLTALERPGGIIAQLEQFIQATIVARQAESVRLPATRIDLGPTVAQPVRQ